MTTLSIATAVERYQIQNVPDAFEQIFKQMNLPKCFLEHNTERGRLNDKAIPFYHDKKHTQRVFVQAYEGGLWSQLSTQEAKEVAVAALYHDAMHYGIAGIPDVNNIRAAVQSFEYILEEFKFGKHFSEDNANNVKQLIKDTHFPHTKEKASHGPTMVLRDADILSSIYIVDRHERLNSFLGLFNESIYAGTQAVRGMGPVNRDYQLFIEKQQAFLLSYQFKTAWARHKYLKFNLPALVRTLVNDLQFQTVGLEGGYRCAKPEFKG